jgi:hypothetical protein
MTLQKELSKEGKGKFRMISRLTLLGLLGLTVAIAGMASPKETAQSSAQQQEVAPPGGVNEYEGIVKVGLGKYFYLPSAKGFDIVVQGKIEGKDASALVGKEIKVKGILLKDEPSVFVADSIEIKEAGQYRNVFTRTGEVTLEGHISARDRLGFPALTVTSATKNEEWEGKGKVKVHGALTKITTAEGKETEAIVVTDDKGKEVGKILVDKKTDCALYYIKKLRLFDKFWFYINIKDTVDAKVRKKTRELFHSDLLFAGLY